VPLQQLSLIAFPTSELFSEKISCFDLIIFDHYQHGISCSSSNTKTPRAMWSRTVRGWSPPVMIFAGQMSLSRAPLSVVLPATPTRPLLEQSFKATLASDGLKHPVTGELPVRGEDPAWGRWFRQAYIAPSRGRIVMKRAEERPNGAV
jgi:hypothetical protein